MAQAPDLNVGQLSGWGHLQSAPLLDRLDEQTLRWLAGHDGRAGFTPLEETLSIGEPQASPGFLGSVAGLALLGENGPDLFLEEVGGPGIGAISGLGGGRWA
jgi:hypothetical protein